MNSNGECCANNLAYDSDMNEYRIVNNKDCGCPTDKNGKKGNPGTNDWTCCSDNLGYDSFHNTYTFIDAKHCGCPTDKYGKKGNPGKNDWICCADNLAYQSYDNTYAYTHADCGCPKAKDGRIGESGKASVCCLDNLAYDDYHQSYTLPAPQFCGCPAGGEEKDGSCCKDGKGLICVTAYSSKEIEGNCFYMAAVPACGCPDDGEDKDGVCCKDGKRWNVTIDPESGWAVEYGYLYYSPLCGSCPIDKNGNQGKVVKTEDFGDICCLDNKIYTDWTFGYDYVNAMCGCPDGGEPAEDGQTCCKNNFAYGIDAYDTFDRSQCGCPEGGEDKDGVCCKDGRSYTCKEEGDKEICAFDGINPACGCPTDKNGKKGSPGKNSASCCADKLLYDEQENTYSIVNAYACGCPEGTEEKGYYCCKNGLQYTGTGEGSMNAACGCPIGKDGTAGTAGTTEADCCKDGYLWNEQTQDYTEFDEYKCGCPDGGTSVEFWEGANVFICCKNHKAFNDKTKKYDLEDTTCGCPDDKEETEGHCCPIGSVWLDDEQPEAQG